MDLGLEKLTRVFYSDKKTSAMVIFSSSRDRKHIWKFFRADGSILTKKFSNFRSLFLDEYFSSREFTLNKRYKNQHYEKLFQINFSECSITPEIFQSV